jgi:hypothetical protein
MIENLIIVFIGLIAVLGLLLIAELFAKFFKWN